jgi:hypothetical protein
VKRTLFIVYAIFFSFVVGYAVFASVTFDGAITHSYEKGMEYPQKIARLKTLGWQFKVGNDRLQSGKSQPLDLWLTTDKGQPVAGARVSMQVTRPASPDTLPTILANEEEKGHYKGVVTLPGYGHWLVKVSIDHFEEQIEYEFRIYASQGEFSRET